MHALTRQLAANLVRRQHHRQRHRARPVPDVDAEHRRRHAAATSRAPTGTRSVAATRAGAVGTPEDIAGLAIFLASRAGAFTVGEVITCDGGIVARG